MKIDNAPEKIYFTSIEDGTHYYTEGIPFEREYIEYVRKDAFIEKACDAYCKVCGHYPHTTPNHICRQACDYYKDFVKYMKGE